jgi:23S rRNA pseudouridine2605 synthase
MTMIERLQKVMAKAGIASRRASEELIRQGRVTVDGQRAEVGMKVDAEEVVIRIDGQRIAAPEKKIYILLNKPVGVLSSTKSQGGLPTVLNYVGAKQRIYPVGRLDADSEGLILLTNDGNVAHRLTHPRFKHEKEYRVELNRRPDDAQLGAWRNGVVLSDGFRTKPAKVWRESSDPRGQWVGVILEEGRKRQIRETAEILGMRVKRIIRVRMHILELGKIKPGEWRPLRQDEISRLITSLSPKN